MDSFVQISPVMKRRAAIRHQSHFTDCKTVLNSRRKTLSFAKSVIPPTPFQKKCVPMTSFTHQRTKRRLKFSANRKNQTCVKSQSPSKKRKIWRNTYSPSKRQSLYKNHKSRCLSVDRSRGPTFYQNHGLIGTGSFSLVYRVVQDSLKKTYALKQSKTALLSPETAESALREVLVVKKIDACFAMGMLKFKKNIVRLHKYWFSIDNHLCQLYDFYGHGSLKELVEYNNRFNTHQIFKIIQQLCGALTLIHSLDICHLDLKPENIFVDEDFVCKIGDFGISIIKTDPNNKDLCLFEHCGDPIYAAPEMLNSFNDLSVACAQSDIYSLGIILLELLLDVKVPSRGPIFEHLRNGNVDLNWLQKQHTNQHSHASSTSPFNSPFVSPFGKAKSKIAGAHANSSFTLGFCMENKAESDDDDILDFFSGTSGFGGYCGASRSTIKQDLFVNTEIGKRELENLCKKMLKKDPKTRPSASQIYKEISTFLIRSYDNFRKEGIVGLEDLRLPQHIDYVASLNTDVLNISDMSVKSECIMGTNQNWMNTNKTNRKQWFYQTSIQKYQTPYKLQKMGTRHNGNHGNEIKQECPFLPCLLSTLSCETNKHNTHIMNDSCDNGNETDDSFQPLNLDDQNW